MRMTDRYETRVWDCPNCGTRKSTAGFRGHYQNRSGWCADCRDTAVRASMSLRLRFAILKRDEFTCQYCGHSAPDVKLQVDHVIPVAHGGTNDPDNLTTACEMCNRGKHDAIFY